MKTPWPAGSSGDAFRSPLTARPGSADIYRAGMGFLSRIVVDTSALTDSRDFRLLTLGTFVSSLGSQIALVALPYQVYIITGSSFQVGLIGLVELFPFVAAALLGGHAGRPSRPPKASDARPAAVAVYVHHARASGRDWAAAGRAAVS